MPPTRLLDPGPVRADRRPHAPCTRQTGEHASGRLLGGHKAAELVQAVGGEQGVELHPARVGALDADVVAPQDARRPQGVGGEGNSTEVGGAGQGGPEGGIDLGLLDDPVEGQRREGGGQAVVVDRLGPGGMLRLEQVGAGGGQRRRGELPLAKCR